MNILDLLIVDRDVVKWEDVHLDPKNKEEIEQVMKEFKYADVLTQYGLPVNHKILLHGHSGCGKTMTAKAIASRLNKPLLVLNLSSFVSPRIGETAKHLKLVFDKAERERAVLFLDEFDFVGKMRGNDDNDVGEMRRLVNAVIQMMDQFSQKSILIAATNHVDILDVALLRRFQVRISYELPSDESLDVYYNALLHAFPEAMRQIKRRYSVSYAEAKDYALSSVKAQLIKELESGGFSSD